MKPAIILLTLLFFVSCNKDEFIIEGLPMWIDNYPIINHGATSIDVDLELDRPGIIYFLLSNTNIDIKSSIKLKEEALKYNNKSFIQNGRLVFDNSRILIEFEDLNDDNDYYLYITTSSLDDSLLNMDYRSFEIELPKRQPEEDFITQFSNCTGKYYCYKPESYFKTDSSFPLLVFLHGNGSKGTSLSKIFNGPPALIRKGIDFPFVVVSPQIKSGEWDDELIDEFLTFVISEYRIDTKKIYLTGTSLGAIGIWNYIIHYSDHVTAVVPCSGKGDVSRACNINVPVWAFHGEVDTTIDPSGSIDMVKEINDCNSKFKAKVTIYEGVGHNAGKPTYDGSGGYDIYKWMLSISK